MGDQTNDEWWRHDEPAVNERHASAPSSGRPSRAGGAAGQGARDARGSRDVRDAHGGRVSSPRPVREGRTVRPETGRREAASLPNARSRAHSGARPANGPRGYRQGPAQRLEYGESERCGRGTTIPDDRPPRRRPRQQRPLGWSQHNVPQFRDTSAKNGGWRFRTLSSAPAQRIPPLAFAAAGIVLLVVLVVFVVRGISGCVSSQVTPAAEAPTTTEAAADAAATTVAATTTDPNAPATKVLACSNTASGMGRMSFSAVGDNLMNENLLTLADGWAGSVGDGTYDFSPFYAEVAPVVQSRYDVSFINQETTLGGSDRYDYMGYPSYNTPDSLADAVADAGWRIVNTNSNHTYDTWTPSIEHAQQVWDAKTGLVTIGSYASEADRDTVRVVECNGIRLAALSYCYGQNGYEQSDLPNDYYAVPYDEAKMRSDVERARQVADVVLVYMHWGEEYTNGASDEQRAIAQVCADIGVDVVIGSHAHVIQPVEWVSRSGGGKMLCAYGLGDFVSGYQNSPNCILSGMLSCDFVRVGEDEQDGEDVGPGGIAVRNVVWHPLVEHMAGNTDVVRFVKGYSADDANANELLSSVGDPTTWPLEKTREVIGDAITIDA